METAKEFDSIISHQTSQLSAQELKRKMHVLLDGVPCQIIDLCRSKVGYHGIAKIYIKGTEVFSGKKIEKVVPEKTIMNKPEIIIAREYELLSIYDDGKIAFADEDGKRYVYQNVIDDSTRSLNENLKQDFEGGKRPKVSYIATIGMAKILGYNNQIENCNNTTDEAKTLN